MSPRPDPPWPGEGASGPGAVQRAEAPAALGTRRRLAPLAWFARLSVWVPALVLIAGAWSLWHLGLGPTSGPHVSSGSAAAGAAVSADTARAVARPASATAITATAASTARPHASADGHTGAGLTFDPCVSGLPDDTPPHPSTVARAAAVLKAAPSPEAQALGVWLPFMAAYADEKQAQQAHEDAADALARLALSSSRPGPYAMALDVCAKQRQGATPSACSLLSPRRLAELAPDNATPWLAIGEQAAREGDAATASEALYRVSMASHADLRSDALLAHATPALQALAEPERSRLAVLIGGVQAAWVHAPVAWLVRQCSEAALRDANVRQVCEGVANLLVDRSPLLLHLVMGRKLGEGLGWPADRLHALRQLSRISSGESPTTVLAASDPAPTVSIGTSTPLSAEASPPPASGNAVHRPSAEDPAAACARWRQGLNQHYRATLPGEVAAARMAWQDAARWPAAVATGR